MNTRGRVAGIKATALIAVLFAAASAAPVTELLRSVANAVTSPVFAHDGSERDRNGLPAGSVWVVNRDLGELAVFDAETGRVITRLLVGPGAHDICISEQAQKAYIAAETINAVTTVDTKTLAMETIAVGPLPHHVEPSPNGRTVYVSLASHTPAVGAPLYAAIDTHDNSVAYTTSSANPGARSHGPRPSLDGRTIYLAHDTGDEVTAVNVRTAAIAFTVAAIPRAEEIAAGRFGDLLWASSRGDGTVKRIDLETNRVTGSVAVGVQPESVMLTPSERTLVTSLRGTPATLAFVDTVNLTLRGTLPIAGTGTFGDLAVITKDGRFVYATFDAGAAGTGGVAVVDVRERKVVATWAYPGAGRPHGIWFSKTKPRH